jgi:hypothetical protein
MGFSVFSLYSWFDRIAAINAQLANRNSIYPAFCVGAKNNNFAKLNRHETYKAIIALHQLWMSHGSGV